MKNWKKLENIFIIIYLGVGLFTIFHHEPWRDEAQAWLLARDIPFLELFKQMGYEGTPALWTILLIPLVKLEFPYFSLNLFHLCVATGAIAIFIYNSPFSKLTKAVFTFSHFMFWEYAIVARNYSISVLLLFVIASTYRTRFLHPVRYAILVFLLFNTNVHSVMMAGALFILFLYETYQNKAFRLNLPALVMMGAGGLGAFLQLLPPKDVMWGSSFFHIFEPKAAFIAISNAFLPHASLYSILPGALLGLVITGMAGYLFFRRTKKVFFLLAISFTGLFYVFIFKYTGSVRHHGFLLIFTVFCIWIHLIYKNPDSTKSTLKKVKPTIALIMLLNISLFLSIVPGFIQHSRDHAYIFSGAKDMAQYISENHLEDHTIVAQTTPASSALLPYLPKVKFWYVSTRQFGTFPRWNLELRDNMHLEFKEIMDRIEKQGFASEKVLLLLNYPIPLREVQGFELLHEVMEEPFIYKEERFFLYRIPVD